MLPGGTNPPAYAEYGGEQHSNMTCRGISVLPSSSKQANAAVRASVTHARLSAWPPMNLWKEILI